MAYSKRGDKTRPAKPLRIRTGDDVIVLTGKSRDPKTPRKVLGTLPQEGKVIVEGVNMMKDRQKPKGGQRASGINQEENIVKPFPIDASNVALIDPKSGKATRVKMVVQDGKRVRVSVKSGDPL